jgi:hypothetical protein
MSKQRIVTSCWHTKLPADYAPIAICRGTPNWRSGYRRYIPLNPLRRGFHASREVFTRIYTEEVLGILEPERVVKDLLDLADGRIPALLCWEPPEPGPRWCHRSLVSVWLWERLGLEVPEFGLEREGFGWSHPKLHPDVRRLGPGAP